MAGYSKIRWQKTDSEELNRAVKNFNAKIKRIAKKNPELKNALPELARVKGYVNENGKYIPGYKDLINTRQDLKRELNALKRFTDKNNRIGKLEDGTYEGIKILPGDNNTKITKWEEKEINRRRAFINKRRANRLKILEETPVKSRGQEQGYTKGEIGMGKAERIELMPIEGITPGANEVSIHKKFRSILIQSQSDFYTLKDFRCRENYITGLYKNFSSNDVEDLVELIKDMPLNEFLDTFNSDPDAKFETFYTPSPEEQKKALNTLHSIWLPNKKAKTIGNNISKTIREFEDNLEALKTLEPVNGYINIYSNGEKVGKFSNGKSALNYIRKNKLSDVKYNISR